MATISYTLSLASKEQTIISGTAYYIYNFQLVSPDGGTVQYRTTDSTAFGTLVVGNTYPSTITY